MMLSLLTTLRMSKLNYQLLTPPALFAGFLTGDHDERASGSGGNQEVERDATR